MGLGFCRFRNRRRRAFFMSSDNGAATNGENVPADGHASRGSRGSSLPVPIRTLGQRGSLPLAQFLIGVGAFALTMGVVVSSFLQSREEAKQRYLETTKIEVRMLASAIDLVPNKDSNWDQVRKAVVDSWMQAGHWTHLSPDEHLVIFDNRTLDVKLDITPPGSGDPVVGPSVLDTIVTIHEQMWPSSLKIATGVAEFKKSPARFTGQFLVGRHEMLGSFLSILEPNRTAGRDWLLGVYRAKEGLYAADLRFGLFGTSFRFASISSLVLACILAMLVSLLLMYRTYHLARREQEHTEGARARLAAIVQKSDDAIFSQTFDGQIISWNHGAEQIFGYSESEAAGRDSRTLIPSQHEADEESIIRQIQRGESPAAHALESIRVRKDGRPIHVSQSISPLEDSDGRQIGVSIIARDITARKNLEREVLEITSNEQQRIGRELHDSLGQELTGLSYLAKGLAHKLSAEENPQTAIAHTIADSVQRALREVRRAVEGLVPVEVDASGFLAALEKLATETSVRCGIDCRVEGDDRVRIDDNVVATHLFRIVQEAINNAVKHGQPRQILVRPELSNGTISVTVQDDGVGIATEPSSRNGGMGLRIMQYRAGVIDATLEVRRREGRGTSVVCQINNPPPPAESSTDSHENHEAPSH
jgi:PAS domain S-box-containing protein